ncbi:MAG: cysteine hydrolase family protein [Desulfovibrio sp.]|uniref:cysteine hydrolase family protein n=1 Tax=Desulfovibrio sp. 7SRBS1 TaxID=3378064 RepID=UPI003B3D8C9B
MKQAAVLVIDVQQGLFDPAPRPFEADAVIERINEITMWALENSIPVIFIQHESPGSILAYDTQGWQLQDELETSRENIIVRKTTPDSFLKTDLEAVLKERHVEHLIVCGYASEFCVDTTVRRAAGLGYSVDLVSDAHTTHDKPHSTAEQIRLHHNCTLPNIKSFGVKISAVATADLIRSA